MARVPIANLKGPKGATGPRGLPGPGAENNDTVTAALIDAAAETETGAALTGQIQNPESPVNAAILGIVPDGVQVVFHGADAQTARPNAVQVMWIGVALPAHALPGDIFLPGGATPLPLPLTFASLQAWWDPSLAEVAGGDVSSVPDRSAHGRTLTVAAGSGITDVPQRANVLNGTPAFVFPAVSALTTGALATAIGSGPVTVACVAQFPNLSTGTQTIINQDEDTLAAHNLGIYRTESGGAPNAWGFRRGGTNQTGGTADDDPHTFIGVFNGTSSVLYVDGVQVASGSVGSASVTSVMLGARNRGNGTTIQNAAMDGGLIGDVCLFDEAFTIGQVAAMHTWLSGRSGL